MMNHQVLAKQGKLTFQLIRSATLDTARPSAMDVNQESVRADSEWDLSPAHEEGEEDEGWKEDDMDQDDDYQSHSPPLTNSTSPTNSTPSSSSSASMHFVNGPSLQGSSLKDLVGDTGLIVYILHRKDACRDRSSFSPSSAQGISSSNSLLSLTTNSAITPSCSVNGEEEVGSANASSLLEQVCTT